MSEAYLAGTLKHLPDGGDHVRPLPRQAHLSKAIDEVRRAEAKQHGDLLKSTRYLWLNARRTSPPGSRTGSMSSCASRSRPRAPTAGC